MTSPKIQDRKTGRLLTERFPPLPYYLYALFITLLFFFFHGYQFNQGDQIEHLLPVYQKLDPALFRQDFYMQYYNQTFTVRFYYVWLIYSLAKLTGVPTVCFLLNLGCVFLSVTGCMQLAKRVSASPAAMIFAPLFVLFIFYDFTIGGNNIQYGMLTCSVIAKGLAIWGMVFFIDKRLWHSGIFLGIASLFQVLVGLQLFLLLGTISLIHLRKLGLKSILAFGLSYILIASFIIIPVLLAQQHHPEVKSSEFISIMMYFRNPHHYLPSAFPLRDYVKHFALLVTATILFFIKPLRQRNFLLLFTLLTLVGMTVYALFFESGILPAISKIQWFKTTIWTTGFAAIIIACRAADSMRWSAIVEKIVLFVSILAIPLLLFVILFSSWIPIERLQGKFRVGFYHKSEQELFYEWIADHTDKNAVFLINLNDELFQCTAKRSLPVSYKGIIHEPAFAKTWYKRISDIYGISLENTSRTESIARKAAELYNTRHFRAKNYGISYRIDNVRECRYLNELGPIIHRSGDWIMTPY